MNLDAQIRYARRQRGPEMRAILATLEKCQLHDADWIARRNARIFAEWQDTGETNKRLGERYGMTGARISQIIGKATRKLEWAALNGGLKCLNCGLPIKPPVSRYPAGQIMYQRAFACAECGHWHEVYGRHVLLRSLSGEQVTAVARERHEHQQRQERIRRLEERWPCPGCGVMAHVGADLSEADREHAVNGWMGLKWLFCSKCGYLQVVDGNVVRREPTEAERRQALGQGKVQRFLEQLNASADQGHVSLMT